MCIWRVHYCSMRYNGIVWLRWIKRFLRENGFALSGFLWSFLSFAVVRCRRLRMKNGCALNTHTHKQYAKTFKRHYTTIQRICSHSPPLMLRAPSYITRARSTVRCCFVPYRVNRAYRCINVWRKMFGCWFVFVWVCCFFFCVLMSRPKRTNEWGCVFRRSSFSTLPCFICCVYLS